MDRIVQGTHFCYDSLPAQLIECFDDSMKIFQKVDTAIVCGGNSGLYMVETLQEMLSNSNRTIPVYIDATMGTKIASNWC